MAAANKVHVSETSEEEVKDTVTMAAPNTVHVSETPEEEVKDTLTMAAVSVSEESTSGEPGRSKSDHESVCAVPCELRLRPTGSKSV